MLKLVLKRVDLRQELYRDQEQLQRLRAIPSLRHPAAPCQFLRTCSGTVVLLWLTTACPVAGRPHHIKWRVSSIITSSPSLVLQLQVFLPSMLHDAGTKLMHVLTRFLVPTSHMSPSDACHQRSECSYAMLGANLNFFPSCSPSSMGCGNFSSR